MVWRMCIRRLLAARVRFVLAAFIADAGVSATIRQLAWFSFSISGPILALLVAGLAMIRRAGLFSLLVAGIGATTSIPGEVCPSVPGSATCGATQDLILVIDNSYSVADRWEQITEFMNRIIDQFTLDPSDQLSAKIGIVTFSGCVGCSAGESAKVLYPLSSDATALHAAIDERVSGSRQPARQIFGGGLGVSGGGGVHHLN